MENKCIEIEIFKKNRIAYPRQRVLVDDVHYLSRCQIRVKNKQINELVIMTYDLK